MSINPNVEKELINIETIVNNNDAVRASLASILLLAPVGTGTRGNAALICSVAEKRLQQGTYDCDHEVETCFPSLWQKDND